ncbi:hypothetical protein NDU88_008537 [Pleurodeles waltl]|uniref:Uncharacterized protein n=1 Tax=Pleurodeles waltl TaxID=8319 RepID=A0AAV7RVR9_PLEWA|nr:hypothetical protein NDU88_008537 [Pleurodeles waltl]
MCEFLNSIRRRVFTSSALRPTWLLTTQKKNAHASQTKSAFPLRCVYTHLSSFRLELPETCSDSQHPWLPWSRLFV